MTFAARLIPRDPLHDQRLRGVIEEHLDLVWRTLRRLGVEEAELEDATQKVFLVVSQKLASIALDRERSFVFGTSVRVASHARRARKRRREQGLEETAHPADRGPSPEEAMAQREALDLLAQILERMPDLLRETFLLYELEQLSMVEIADMTQVPLGTVASRLRRAREQFHAEVRRFEAQPEEWSHARA
jgi:RNA polymerase sigma-70 factor (ECF subfamily)